MSARALALKSGSISGQGEGLGRSGTAGQRSGVQAAFLPRGWARYDLAKPGSLVLVPEGHVLGSVWSDYRAMENMIFEEVPLFEEILVVLQALQEKTNTPFGKI